MKPIKIGALVPETKSEGPDSLPPITWTTVLCVLSILVESAHCVLHPFPGADCTEHNCRCCRCGDHQPKKHCLQQMRDQQVCMVQPWASSCSLLSCRCRCSCSLQGGLDQMTFEGSFQLRPFCDSHTGAFAWPRDLSVYQDKKATWSFLTKSRSSWHGGTQSEDGRVGKTKGDGGKWSGYAGGK